MWTRREFMAAAAAGVCFGKASQPSTPVNFTIPPGACDCHTHIIGDPARFPFSPNRTYTPEPASPEEMAELHRALHIQRVVIVTPSVYGAGNSATLFGMKARGANARGIAVIDESTSADALDELERAGMRGIRINLATIGQNDPAVARQRFQAAVPRIRHLAWHIQMNTNLRVIAALADMVAASPVPVVFDHFGGADASLGVAQKGWPELLELVRHGKAYVKVSGEYGISTMAPDYADVEPFARALVAANPDFVLWGSDWPHTTSKLVRARPIAEVTPLTAVDDGELLNRLAIWVPDAGVRKRILVDNPARLYRF